MQIHVDRGGQRFGPYEVEEVNAYLASGSLLDTDLGWTDGMTDWVPLSQLPGVATSAGAPPAHSNSAGQSAGKRKLFIGIGASVGVCVIGVVVWLFFIKGDGVKPDDGKAGAGVSSGDKKSGLTLAEFIKDKRIYYGKRERKTGTVYNFRQYNADGTFQEGLEDEKGNTVLPPKPPDLVRRYEVDGLTIKLKVSMRGQSFDSSLTCPKAEISGGDKLVGKSPDGPGEFTVIKVTSGPFKPSINVESKGRPSSSGKSPSGGAKSGGRISPAKMYKAFEGLDRNKDRKISRAEISHIPAWGNLFGKVDTSGNGFIEWPEYLRYFLRISSGGGG